MRKIRVIDQPLKLFAGVVELTPEQHRRRSHNLRGTTYPGNQYDIVGPIEFKVGEELGYTGDLPKGVTEDLSAPAKKPKAAKPKAAKPKAAK